MRRRRISNLPPLLIAAALCAAAAPAAELTLDRERSVLAVLTHKAGIAKGLAHDHLITAPLDALRLELDPAAPEGARATLVLPVARLEIDHFAARAAWKGRLLELGVGPKELAPIAESDRIKVRQAMLADDQLDAERFPELHAELVGLSRAANPKGELDGVAKIRLTIRGKTIERDLAARWSVADGVLTAEALGELAFTDFGIEPYSGAFGAVRNEDRFHLYLKLVGTPN